MANGGNESSTGDTKAANNAPAGTLRITADATLKIPAVPAEPAKPTGEAPNQPAPQGQPNATENQAGEPGTQPTAENRGVEAPGRPLSTNQPPSAEATGGEPGDENQPGQQKNPEETNKPEAGKEGQPGAEHNQQPQGGTEGQPAKQPGQKPPSAEATGGKPPSAETPGGKPLNEKPATVQPGGGGAKQGEPPAKKPERTGRRVRNPLNDFRRGQQLGLRSLLSRRGLNREITKKALGFLLKNPYVLAGVMAILIIGVVIVVSIAIFAAPTGSSAQQGANPVTNHKDILTLLANAGNPQARAEKIRTDKQEIKTALEALKQCFIDAGQKDQITAIDDLIKAVDAIQGSDYTATPLAAPLQTQVDNLDKAYTKYTQVVKTEQCHPGVLAYINYANSVLTAHKYSGKYGPITGIFCEPRSASIYRSAAGWHNGYDIAAPKGTYVIVEQAGTLTAVVPWTNVQYGISVRHAEGSETYTATYGHAALLPKAGKALGIIRNEKPMGLNIGDRIEQGDIVGTMDITHVDIKWRRGTGLTEPVDWGTGVAPYPVPVCK